MADESNDILDYWDQNNVESMYDKNLLNAEINLINKLIQPGMKILDAGCGEGEGTIVYAANPDVTVHAADFSDTRLRKANERLAGVNNVIFYKVDFLKNESPLDRDYDAIISQRFLINVLNWELQQKVLEKFQNMLKNGGKLILLEGSLQGVNELNALRACFNQPAIPVKWHNLFIDENLLLKFMDSIGFKLQEINGLGGYFLLTRGIRPFFDTDLNWKSEFNRISADKEVEELLNLGARFSRLRLYTFQNERKWINR